MALLFFDGFDHHGLDVTSSGKWGSSAGTASPSGAVGARTGTLALRLSSNGEATTKALPASGGFVVGFALYLQGASLGGDLVQIREGAIVHLALGVTTGNQFQVKRGATVLATGSTVVSVSSWYYIEFKGVIDDVSGSYELRIDSVPEAALTTAGPVDTRNAGTGQWDRVRFLTLFTFNTTVTAIDDLYVLDLSGGAPRNTFLGPVRVELLMPQTDAVAAGSNAGLTPSAGTDHGALVDEVGPNTTDYNSHATVGLKDTYQYPPMTLAGTVYGVQTNLYVAKSDAAVRQVCPVVRTAGVDTDGANVSPLTTFGYFTQVWPQDPNAGSPIEWTSAAIATLQAGMKVTA